MLAAPDDTRVLGEYGKTLAAMGRSDDALAFLERATQLQPGDWSLLSALGVAFDQKGNYQAAQAAYARALVLKPGEPAVLNNDALSHMQAGDLDGAEALLRAAAPGTPDYPRIAENLALVQSLKAAKPKAANVPAPAAIPSPVIAAAQAPAPMAAAALAPAPVEVKAAEEQVAAPLPPPTPVLAVALESPPAQPAIKNEPTAIEILRADPTVRMQPVPKDEQAGPMPRVLPAQPEAAATKAPEKTVAPALAASDSASAAPTPKPGAIQARSASPNSAYYVQAGSYLTEARAGEAASELDRLGARVTSGLVDGRAVYRVRIGPFRNIQQANAAIEQVHSLGRPDVRIVTE